MRAIAGRKPPSPAGIPQEPRCRHLERRPGLCALPPDHPPDRGQQAYRPMALGATVPYDPLEAGGPQGLTALRCSAPRARADWPAVRSPMNRAAACRRGRSGRCRAGRFHMTGSSRHSRWSRRPGSCAGTDPLSVSDSDIQGSVGHSWWLLWRRGGRPCRGVSTSRLDRAAVGTEDGPTGSDESHPPNDIGPWNESTAECMLAGERSTAV